MPEDMTVPPQPRQTARDPGGDVVFHAAFLEQPGLWRRLWRHVQEVVHPPRQPQLQLESQPVPVQDIWSKDEKSLPSKAGSVVLHVVAMALILAVAALKPVRYEARHAIAPIFVPAQPPSPPPPDVKVLRLVQGHAALPPAPPQPLPVHPMAPAMAAPAAIVPLSPAAGTLPFVHDAGAAAGAPGPADGAAYPGGANGNCDPASADNCVYGAGIAAPEPIYEPDPEYSDAARKARFQGTVTVRILIGADGLVKSARVVQPLGMGLDEKAIAAVMQWKFIPAKWQGRPVPLTAEVQVNFRLY